MILLLSLVSLIFFNQKFVTNEVFPTALHKHLHSFAYLNKMFNYSNMVSIIVSEIFYL